MRLLILRESGQMEWQYRRRILQSDLPPYPPGIGGIQLAELTEDTVTSFYDSLRSQELSVRSVWCVHLLLRRCMDEVACDQHFPYNPVRLCKELQPKGYKNSPFTPGIAPVVPECEEQLGALPLFTQGSLSACGNVDLSPCRGPVFIFAAGTSSRDSA